MQSLKLKNILTFVVALLLATVAYASEEAKEEPKEGAPGGPASKESIEYAKKEARLNTLRGRIDEANKRFAELIEQKNASKDPQVKQRLAEEMIAVAKERNGWVGELTSLRQEVMYQYPNKGQAIDKKFMPGVRKGNPEAEHDSGLDVKLSETKKNVDKKYGPLIPKEDQEAEAASAKPAKAAADQPKKLRLEK
ncbi:MAG: hypothetical protein AB7N80_09965 [Bdellovibrionales bacterium]